MLMTQQCMLVHNDSIDDATQILNIELPIVASWFDSNKLTLNVNKTQMIMVSRKKRLTPRNEWGVERMTKANFLGVVVEKHLNWKDHITMISPKMSKSCCIIYWIRNNFDIKSNKLIYYSKEDLSAHSLLQHSNLIQQIYSQLKHFYPLLNWLNYRNEYLLIRWTVINTCWVTFSLMDIGYVDGHHQLRNIADLRIPLHETTHVQQFVRYRAIKTWNNLPATYVVNHHLIVLIENLN